VKKEYNEERRGKHRNEGITKKCRRRGENQKGRKLKKGQDNPELLFCIAG
jgi:hypothetical protein